MLYNYIMYCVNYTVYIEDEDQCMTCENYAKGIACPLLEALGQGVVYLEDSLTVSNCGFYKEFKRTLKLVKEEEKK
jgi:hypothetical protein